MRDAILNLLAKMEGRDVVAALALTLGAGLGALGLTYACGYEIYIENGKLSIRKANMPRLEA